MVEAKVQHHPLLGSESDWPVSPETLLPNKQPKVLEFDSVDSAREGCPLAVRLHGSDGKDRGSLRTTN